MSKTRRITFIAMNIANYLLVLFAVLFYRFGGPLHIPFMLIAQPVLTAVNYFVAKKIPHLIILSINLLISTIIANVVSIYLYMQNICGDYETLLVGKYEVVIGSIYVIVLSLIAIGVKFATSKLKKG